MKVLDKKSIIKILGQYGMFEAGKKSNHIIHKVKYLTGIPELDNMKNIGKLDTDNTPIIIRMRPYGLEFEFSTSLTKPLRVGLVHNQFNFWSIELSNEIKQNNTNSIIGSAAVGGLFFGKTGAIAGGLSAYLDKAEYILSISYRDSAQERIALFTSNSSNSSKVYDYMMKNFSSLRSSAA